MNQTLKDFLITIFFVAVASFVSYIVKINGNATDSLAIIYTLTVVIVSRFTNGYIWGIIASILGIIGVNFLFTYPYLAFNFMLSGYPLTFTAMLFISVLISAMTTKYKKQTEEAIAMAEELKETYEERRKIEIIAEKEKLKGNLLRVISHDLRTPLTSISGAAATLLDARNTTDLQTQKTLLKDIYDESQWLIRMVENLLAITHISKETMKVIKVPEVAEEIIAEAISHLKHKIPENILTVKVPDELIVVPMDATLIIQTIINLVENALKHAGDFTRIQLILTVKDEWAIFEVADDGIGLSEEQIRCLFDYGETTQDYPDASRGYGIGLPTCKSIIEAHSGILEVHSELGRGTCFQFKLPLENTNNTLEGESADE